MQSLPIVNIFNEAGDTPPGIRSIPISQSGHLFLLQGFHEAFRTRIVIRIAHPAHTRQDPMRMEDFGITAASILGRFNRSPQHPKLGGVNGYRKAEIGAVNAREIILARSTTCMAA